MLTPAEELGLSGLSLASRVRKAFHKIAEPELVELLRRMRDESFRRRLIYLRDGLPEPTRVLPCPMTVLPDQLAYVHWVSQTLLNALKRLPDLYFEDPAVHEILRLTPEEDEWLKECWGPGLGENNPVFGRLDAMVDFINPMWKDSLRYVEPNLSGIGGLHLVPTAEGLVTELVLPLLYRNDPQLALERCQDIRDLLM